MGAIRPCSRHSSTSGAGTPEVPALPQAHSFLRISGLQRLPRDGSQMRTVRVTLPPADVAALDEVAQMHGISRQDALKRALQMERLFEQAETLGGRIAIQRADGSLELL